MAEDHDGHTINIGKVTVGKTLLPTDDPHPCSCRVCAAAREFTAMRDEVDRLRAENADLAAQVERIHSRRVEDLHADGATIDRLRTENEALAAALSDIAGMVQPNGTGRWISDAECAGFGPLCWDRYPTRPGEWCSACVAEVAWSAWKLGVLG